MMYLKNLLSNEVTNIPSAIKGRPVSFMYLRYKVYATICKWLRGLPTRYLMHRRATQKGIITQLILFSDIDCKPSV